MEDQEENQKRKSRERKRKYRRIKNEVQNHIALAKKKINNQENKIERDKYTEDVHMIEKVDNLDYCQIEHSNNEINYGIVNDTQSQINCSEEQLLDYNNDEFKLQLEENKNIDQFSSDEKEEDQLRKWAIDNNIYYSTLDELLNILKKRLLPHLPKTSKTFLGVKYNYNIKTIINEDGQTAAEYVYFGLEYKLKKVINPSLHKSGKIKLQINVDGMSVFKSTNLQFWPILAKIYSDDDIYEPFVVGILFSDGKPHNAEQYLNEFVLNINELQQRGLEINNTKFQVSLICFICDGPARCFLKYTKGHGGYGACERCTDRGIRIDNRMIYPNSNAAERTDDDFRAGTDLDHHIAITSLLKINPKIDMIKSFILDYMHLACNGVMLKLIWEFWINGNRKIRLSRLQVRELTRRLLSLKKCIPMEFQRKPRSIACANKWKATELRFFMLYCGPLVLKQLLHTDLYKHFLLLSVAFRILCSDDYKSKYPMAKIFLTKHFQAAPILYGRQVSILNMHNLLHVADDTQNMNCNLNKISAFPFENCLGKLRKYIRTPNKPLVQVCRRLQEKEQFQDISPSRTLPFQIIRSLPKNNYILIKKLKIKNSYTLTLQRPNNCVITKNNTILLIKKISCSTKSDSVNIEISGVIMKKKKSAFNYPLRSRNLNIWEISKTDNELTISIDSIKNKLVFLSFKFEKQKYNKHFVLPFLH